MLDRRFVLGAGGGLLLTGCASAPTLGSASRRAVTLESLVRQLKHDIGTYIFETQDARPEAGQTVCGGEVIFEIKKVQISVSTIVDRTVTESGGLKVPLGQLTLEGGVNRTATRNDTLTTTLSIYPVTLSAADAEEILKSDAETHREVRAAAQAAGTPPDPDALLPDPLLAKRLTAVPPPSPDFEGTPIRDALIRLRNDVVATSDTPPCFDFTMDGAGEDGGEGKPENAVKWAFSVTEKRGGGGKFSLLFFSAGAEGSVSRNWANTITVEFTGRGVGFG